MSKRKNDPLVDLADSIVESEAFQRAERDAGPLKRTCEDCGVTFTDPTGECQRICSRCDAIHFITVRDAHEGWD